MSRLPSKRELWDFAVLLHRMHEHDRHVRCDPTPAREYKGLLGQRRFAYLTGGDVDMSVKRQGDGHIDAVVEMEASYDVNGGFEQEAGEYAIDIKTAERPTCLMVDRRAMLKIERQTAFVLAGVTGLEHDDPLMWDAELLGWDWDHELRKREPYDRGGFGIISYVCHDKQGRESRGRDIYELLAKIKRQWRRRA